MKIAPGRVNLIGEHTDYSSLPVLPMAIDRSVRVELRRSTQSGVRIDSLRLNAPLLLDPDGAMESMTGWHRYALAAAQVVGPFDGGADMLIGGDLPFQGGLSSSSALTVAIVATLAEFRGVALDAETLVARAVEAERRTGVAGGTMDQNVIVRAQPDHAMRIGFDPLSVVQVPVPTDLVVVVADSGTTAAKGEGAKVLYNSRVLGCTIAAARLSAMLDAPVSRNPRLAEVAALDGVSDAVQALPDRMAIDEMDDMDLGRELIRSGWDPSLVVQVRSCAEHVIPEAARVDQALEALRDNDRTRLGVLFDASHASLQRFGVSTPRLDRLVEAMRNAGAAGARLTGAGFGGYAVAVCGPGTADAVVAAGADMGGGPAFRVEASKGLA